MMMIVFNKHVDGADSCLIWIILGVKVNDEENILE